VEPDENGTIELDSFLEFVHTHGGLDVRAVERYLDQVLCGRKGVTLDWESVFVRIGVDRTEWAMTRTPWRSVSTQALWRYVAALLDFPPDEIERAPERWHHEEIGHATKTTPDSMLDSHWSVRDLRASCVAHDSDRCDVCPPPTGFRRSYGIWVAPHPDWPGEPRGRWRH
jgi:hypothetical protein